MHHTLRRSYDKTVSAGEHLMNKRIAFPAILCISICACLPAQAKAPATVVDYFSLISPDALKQTDSKWKAIDIEGGYTIDVTVDIKNGYLSWNDEGTGGGTLTTDAALFVRTDKSIVLAVGKRSFDGVGMSSVITFWEFKNGAMAEITSGIMPAVTASDFLKEKADKQSVRLLGDNLSSLQLEYILPRYGTSIEVRASTNRIDRDLSQLDDQSHAESIRKAADTILCTKIFLDWNMKKGVFTIGKKSDK